MEAGEGGIVISMQGGNGVALQHKDGKWSNPIAVNILSVGGGAVFGYANKHVIVLLNHFAMDQLLKGKGSMSIGVDAGFAVGKVGTYNAMHHVLLCINDSCLSTVLFLAIVAACLTISSMKQHIVSNTFVSPLVYFQDVLQLPTLNCRARVVSEHHSSIRIQRASCFPSKQ